MNKYISLMIVAATLTACQESLEDKADREAREYTEKFCPTPEQNGVITDSLTFDRKTHAFVNYYTFCGELDNDSVVKANAQKFRDFLKQQTRQNVTATAYKDAGYMYRYIYRSQKTKKTLLEVKVTKKDYK